MRHCFSTPNKIILGHSPQQKSPSEPANQEQCRCLPSAPTADSWSYFSIVHVIRIRCLSFGDETPFGECFLGIFTPTTMIARSCCFRRICLLLDPCNWTTMFNVFLSVIFSIVVWLDASLDAFLRHCRGRLLVTRFSRRSPLW